MWAVRTSVESREPRKHRLDCACMYVYRNAVSVALSQFVHALTNTHVQTQTNCVSTGASKNPTQFVAPWDFTTKTSDPEEVCAVVYVRVRVLHVHVYFVCACVYRYTYT